MAENCPKCKCVLQGRNIPHFREQCLEYQLSAEVASHAETRDELTQTCVKAWLERDAALARAVAAEAVVSRLPRTADGVPVVPNMTLYFPRGDGKIDELMAGRMSLAEVDCTDPTKNLPWTWYSTRAAAEAARSKP